jgi:hypothetical protein
MKCLKMARSKTGDMSTRMDALSRWPSTAFNCCVSAGHALCFTLTAPAWVANTVYANGALIEDANGHIQKATPVAWNASTVYAVGAQIVDESGNIQQAAQAQWKAATLYTIGAEMVDAAGHIQKASAAQWVAETTYTPGTEIVDSNGNIQRATATAWEPGLNYSLGYQIVDSNGNIQKVTTAGTSGDTVPPWATSGDTVDGTVTWTYQSSANGNAGTSGTTVPNWTTLVTLDNSPLYWVYIGSSGGNAGTSGAVLPVFDDSGGVVSDAGTLQWTDQGIASSAGTSGLTEPEFGDTTTTNPTPDNGTLVWNYIYSSSGNAGTSGGIIPDFSDSGGTVADGPNTLSWADQGLRLLDVTPLLVGSPVQCDEDDTYFVVSFDNSNKYQISQVLDGTQWPGVLVNEVSAYPDNIVSIICNHRELWVFGNKRTQPYQDTGSAEVFDVIQGAMIETGSAARFSVCRADNSIFWIGQDERGSVMAWRSNGYTPSRVSTHAVEVWLSQQTNIADLVSYSYQQNGHLFWVLYVPNADCSWVYDIGEQLWHKRAAWVNGVWQSHWSWNHSYAFGKTLVGDWQTANLYEMTFAAYDDTGTAIRRLRRAPTITNEKEWIYHSQLTVDFETGLGPQPPLLDGDGNPRPPQAMLRWSDNRGKTWSNQHVRDCGFAGEYNTRVFWMRLGRSRNRVYELSMTDPIFWNLTDAYLKTS